MGTMEFLLPFPLSLPTLPLLLRHSLSLHLEMPHLNPFHQALNYSPLVFNLGTLSCHSRTCLDKSQAQNCAVRTGQTSSMPPKLLSQTWTSQGCSTEGWEQIYRELTNRLLFSSELSTAPCPAHRGRWGCDRHTPGQGLSSPGSAHPASEALAPHQSQQGSRAKEAPD